MQRFFLKYILTVFFFSLQSFSKASPTPPRIYHLAPAHWYVGFSDTFLEIIINAENIDLSDMAMENYPGVTFLEKQNSGNRHISYLHLSIQPSAKPGILQFHTKPSVRRMRYVKSFSFSYELKARKKRTLPPIGQSDVLYRIITDRFSNGDEGNDNSNLKHRSRVDRTDPNARHGGDIKGLIDHLDYFKPLGITTIWLNPVQENDHPILSHLGYSVSNHYAIDPRLGTLEGFQKLVSELAKKELKTMMDINPNDLSTSHWLYQNFDTGWFNSWDTLIQPDFNSYSINDPYYSPGERSRAINSWIDIISPDINQDNIHMRRYLSQTYLWWIEFSGISGYCINRVAFFGNEFLEFIIQKIKSEYPDFAITTDTKTHSVAAQASMVKNNITGFEGNRLESIPDYHVHKVFREMLDPSRSLSIVIPELYTALSDDILYKKPELNLMFLDNSLETRCIDATGNNLDRWKLTCALMFTLRGIPVVYYGTEILLKSDTNGKFPAITDFPGGWKSDKQNKFTAKGRSQIEEEANNYFKKLIQIRTGNPVLSSGRMMQYPVEKGIYVFFRYNDKSTIMVATNTNKDVTTLDFGRFGDRMNGITSFTDVITKETGFVSEPIKLLPGKCTILKLY